MKKYTPSSEGTEKPLGNQQNKNIRYEGLNFGPSYLMFYDFFALYQSIPNLYSPNNTNILFIFAAKMVNAPCNCMPTKPHPDATS